MIDVKTLLVPTDFSETSMRALPTARALAEYLGAEVVLAHACEKAADLDAARPRLAEIASSLDPLPRRAVVGVSGATDFLVELSRTSDRALMVMAAHGRHGLARRLSRRTSARVLSRAWCPVLILKPGDRTMLHPNGDGVTEVKLGRILLPTDFSPTSLKPLAHAGALARAFGAEVLLLHVLTQRKTTMDPTRLRSAHRFLAQLGNRLYPVPRREMLAYGPPARTIVKIAAEQGADLVVMATRGVRTVAGVRRPSIARIVARRAPCPVMTVRLTEEVPVLRPLREVAQPALA